MTPILQVEDLSHSFEGVSALDGVSFHVEPGELLALIGPNGAGKTSVFNCVTGVYRPQRGRVVLGGRDITGMRPHRVARRGLVRTFQNVQVFESMTVLDNLLLGRFNRSRVGVLAGALWEGWAVRDEVRQRRRVEEIADFLEIQSIRHHPVGSLPYGLQKRVELGRALAMEPQVLLLDEPVAGMNREETEDMVRYVLDVREDLGVTVVLVEHDMGVVMQSSDRVCVLDFGQVIAVGEPRRVARDPRVRQAYLGLGEDGAGVGGPGPLPPAAGSGPGSPGEPGRADGPDDGVARIVDLMVADLPLPDLLAACANLVPAAVGSAAVVAVVGGEPVVGVPSGSPAEDLSRDDGWWRDTIARGHPRMPRDLAGFPDHLARQARAAGFGTAWLLPVLDPSTEEPVGCLVVWLAHGAPDPSAVEESLGSARRLAGLAIREERRRHALHREATTDPLTGVANRAALRDHLEGAGARVTVAVVDLDRFKPINDTHGHHVGDAVLQIVAQRLRRVVRDSDLVVRLGGDEFAVVLGGEPRAGSAPVLADRISRTIEAPVQVGELSLRVGASVGIATAPAADVIRQADAALYERKRERRPGAADGTGADGADGAAGGDGAVRGGC